jgi:hypothetical protein
MPFSVVAANGTMEMRSLAAPGTAMRQILDNRLVLVLTDNDGPGRELAPHPKLHQGGRWLEQKNGTHWCLLEPTAEFRAVMERFEIPRAFWPFTIENAFPAALRRQAMDEGCYALSSDPQPDLLREASIAKRTFQAFKDIDQADDANFHLMAPQFEAKDAFAAWITRPEHLTPTNYTAFEAVLSGLGGLLAGWDRPEDQRRRSA